MKFNYSEGYENSPEHFRKFKLFDLFLEKLAERNKEEFSKEIYTSGKFIAVGVGRNDIIYVPSPEMPASIEKQIKKELLRLYPRKMNYKEAEQAKHEYWDFTNPHMVNSEPHPHLVLDCIIAPQGTSLPILQTIYRKISDDKIYNQDVLFDMGFGMADMRLFIVYQAKGDVWIESLELYDPSLPWLNASG
jgi:hypothetical protein